MDRSIHWIQDAISGLHRDSWRYSNSRSFFLPKIEEHNVILHHGSTQGTSSGRVCWVTTEFKVDWDWFSSYSPLRMHLWYHFMGLEKQGSIWPTAVSTEPLLGKLSKILYHPSLEKGSMAPLYLSLPFVVWSFVTVKSWLLILCCMLNCLQNNKTEQNGLQSLVVLKKSLKSHFQKTTHLKGLYSNKLSQMR